jgi:glycerol-1-phosphate dehydrogenase [NAD(P)+]
VNLNKNIIIEKDALINRIDILSSFEKVLFVTTKEIENIFYDFCQKIKKTVFEFYYLTDFTVKNAYDLSYKLTVNHFDCIVSFGGGTVNDTCKLASHYSKKHLISIPTIISNDGVSSNVSVLKFEDGTTDTLSSKSPDTIIIDTNVIKNSPDIYLKSGLCDILANFTALYDWDLAFKARKETKNDVAYIISSNAFWSLYNLPPTINHNNHFIKLACESLILSGIAIEINGSSRPSSGSEHLFNHSINYYYPEKQILHGFLVGLGTLVSAILQDRNLEYVINYLKKYNIDVRPSVLGISKEEFTNAWMNAKTIRNRYTILNEINLNEELLHEIYYKIENEIY